jgi:hypothetical protein
MTREEIENLWKDPQNRRWGVYYCKKDPRVIVPKSIKWMGWTINAARPSAIPVVLLLIAMMAAPVFFVRSKGASDGIVLLTGAVSIGAVCLVCAYLSSRTS